VAPLPARTADALDSYLRESRPALVRERSVAALFTSYWGTPLKAVALVAMLKRRAVAARLPVPLSPHVLRHTCATHLLMGGADVRHVQEILGHAQLDSTMRYTRVVVTDLSRVIERCHPRERQWRTRARR
jgi:integrase/recombinase XerD